jgi:hypothetical protein
MQINVSFDSIDEMFSFAKTFNQLALASNTGPVGPAPKPEPKPEPEPSLPEAYVTVTPVLQAAPVIKFAVTEPVVQVTDPVVEAAPPQEEKPAFTLPATEPPGDKKKRGRPRKLADAPVTGPSPRPQAKALEASQVVFDEDEGASVGSDDDREVMGEAKPSFANFNLAPEPQFEDEDEEYDPTPSAPVEVEGPEEVLAKLPQRAALTKEWRMDTQIYDTPKIGVALEDAVGYLKGQGADLDEAISFILANAGKFKSFPKTPPGEATIRRFVASKFA